MQTMTVIIDGKEEQREIAYYTRDDHESERGRMQRQYPVPVLQANECVQRTADGRTLIIRI